MKDPLNRTNAPKIVRLFDLCFKQGVYDACELADEFGAREFVESHKSSFSFGVLGDEGDVEWQTYRFVLYKIARRNGLTSLGENYILFIRSKNYMWALLPYCLQFYILGVEEWLRYPNRSAIELFKQKSRIHWDQNFPIKKFTLADYVSYMHDFAHAYRKMPVEEMPIGPGTLDSFCSALYDLTRKYVAEKNDL